jgi:hypothetical protein
MFFSSRRYAFLIISSALTVGPLTPAARAQHSRAMNGGSMQSTRPSGMMGMMSKNRGNFPGGFGLNAYRALAGMGRNYMSPYGATGGGQGGYGGGGAGGGGGGGQSQGGGYPTSTSGAGYAPMYPLQDTKNYPQAAGYSQLEALRLFAGGLDWPRALRYFTSDGNLKELREEIDSQVERLLARKDGRPASSDQLDGLKGDVDKLRKRFIAQSYDLPMTSQQETDARRFLGKLKSALEQISASAAVSSSPNYRSGAQ